MAIADYLARLNSLRHQLADNLTEKGVESSQDESLTELVPKVLDIVQGSSGSQVVGTGNTYDVTYNHLMFSGGGAALILERKINIKSEYNGTSGISETLEITDVTPDAVESSITNIEISYAEILSIKN